MYFRPEYSMNKIIGVTELQRKFRSVFDEVVKQQMPYILTRGSRPEAVLIPYNQFLKYAQTDEAGVVDRFNKMLAHLAEANALYTEDEVEADLAAATQTLRARKRQ
jgi:prevent-host-death family protein